MKNRATVILTLILLVLSSLYFVTEASGVITAGAESRAPKGTFNCDGESENLSIFSADKAGYLRIPLPEEVGEEDIKLVNDPFSRMIIISISGADEEFYKENFFSGDMTGIDDVRYGYADGISAVELNTEEMSAPVTEYIKGSFYVKVEPLRKLYKRIIVLDPGHTGEEDPGSVVYGIEERNITSAVAGKLYDKMNTEDTLVIMSAPENTFRSEEEKAAMADKLDADLFLSLHTGADPDTRVTNGVEASGTGSMSDEASKLTELLAENCEQKDLGAGTGNISGAAGLTNVPALRLKLGVITNKAEAEKMNSEEYQEKAADVIAGFIDSVLPADTQ